MLGGKAIARGLRGLIFTESALTIQIQKLVMVDQKIEQQDIESLKSQYQKFINGEITVEEIDKNVLTKIIDVVESKRFELAITSTTAKLWINFMDYIGVIRIFITAARTGDWNLSLVAMQKMINLFAATGHINYARCLRLQLQLMLDLHKTHPWLHSQFANDGFHVIRRSERFWAGLWTDLVIEQVLMKSLKSRGGLTRGRGLTESVRALWVNAMHMCATVHSAMTSITGNDNCTSHQHKELGVSRIKRGIEDLEKVSDWFDTHNPFDVNRSKLVFKHRIDS